MTHEEQTIHRLTNELSKAQEQIKQQEIQLGLKENLIVQKDRLIQLHLNNQIEMQKQIETLNLLQSTLPKITVDDQVSAT